MFTIDQINSAHSKVQSGAGFPAFIREIKQLGVRNYTTFVRDGHVDYAGDNGFRTTSDAKYPALEIASEPNPEQFKSALKQHQQGATDYPAFCKIASELGIYKWVVNLEILTCTYSDADGNNVLVEKIPQ